MGSFFTGDNPENWIEKSEMLNYKEAHAIVERQFGVSKLSNGNHVCQLKIREQINHN